MKLSTIAYWAAFAVSVLGISMLLILIIQPVASHTSMLRANSWHVSLPNTDHAWDLSDRYAITSPNFKLPIEILVMTPEELRGEANLVNFMSAKRVALDLAKNDGYVAFRIIGIDDRLFVTSPLNIED